MSDPKVYSPLNEIADPGQLPLGDLVDDVLEHIWIAPMSYDATAHEVVIGLFVDKEISVKIPGISAATLALGSVQGGIDFEIRARSQPAPFIGVKVPLTLRIDAEILRPLKSGSTTEPDPSKKTLDISLGAIEVGFDTDGNLTFDVPAGINVPRCMIGSTGIVIQIGTLRWITPSTPATELPPRTPPGFTGIYFDDVTVELPKLSVPVGMLRMDDVFIGTGGFSGRVGLSDPTLQWNGQSAGFSGKAVIDIAGFRGGLKQVELAFKQNALTECVIDGNAFIPYLDRVVGLSLGFDGNGGLTAIVQTPTCQFSPMAQDEAAVQGPSGYIITANTDAFTLDISRVELHTGGNEPTALALSGRAKLKVTGFELPGVVFKGLRIDTQGHVAVEGGWLDVDTAKSSALSGFPFQITKIGFGAETDGSRWIGLNGGIKLAEGLPVGASVEGLRVIWKPNGQVSFSLEGIGLELKVQGVFSFAGKVAFFRKDDASGFRGTINLSLDTLKVSVDAGFMIGRTDDGTTFFFFFLDVGLPVGIPLFSTGAAIYGFAGLLAVHLNPDRVEGEDWYYGYYKRPQVGVTDPAKWRVERGGFALGLGTTIGSLPDTGFAISAKILLILVLPGPRLLLQGKGQFISQKPDEKDPAAEGTFEALLVLDIPAKLFQANLAVAFKIADLIEIAGGVSAAFSWAPSPPADLWHVYLGEKTPAERRIHATVFKLLKGDNWLMINRPGALAQLPPDRKGDFEMGGSLGIAFNFDFTVAKAWLDASLIGEAAVSWEPQQFTGSLALRGSAGIAALGLSIVADLLAQALVKAPTPWYLSIDVEVGIKIDLLFVKWEFRAKLPLEFGRQDGPLPEPVSGHAALSADHEKADEAKPLASAVVPPDVRPLVIFKRPVQDRARFGAPGRDEIEPEDLGIRKVSYQLRHIVLIKNDAGGARLVGAAGEVAVSGASLTFTGLEAANGLPDLSGAEITLFRPGMNAAGPFTITAGGGALATLAGNAPQGKLSYRLTAPRATAAVQIASWGYRSGEVTLTVSAPIANPDRFRGGSLTIGALTWLVLEATSTTIRARVSGVLPAGLGTLRGPDPSVIEGKWMPSGDPVTSADSSTRLQLWARTPFSFFRHNEQTAIAGLDAFRPDYACGPEALEEPEEPICTRFEDVATGLLAGQFSTAGVRATATDVVTAVSTGHGSDKRLMLGVANVGWGTVTFTFDARADAVWVTGEQHEAGFITALKDGAVVARVRMENQPLRRQFSGGIDAIIVEGLLASVSELCFTPGWSCIHFEAQSFPPGQSGEVSYAGVTLVSDGAMTVDGDMLEVDPPPENLATGPIVTEPITTYPGGESALMREPIMLAVSGLVEPALVRLPSLGAVQLLPGLTPAPTPQPGVADGGLLPARLVTVEPWRDKFNIPGRNVLVDTGRVWVQGNKAKLASLAVLFPQPVTRVRVRLGGSAEVIAFAGTLEVTRAIGGASAVIGLYADPMAAVHIGWIDRVVIIAASQVRVSAVCTDAGDFGWERYEQWKWSQGVQRSVESLYQTGPVLPPGDYELRVHTAAVVTGAVPETRTEVECATFTVGQPPGFPTSQEPVDPAGRYPEAGPLTNLSTYVDRTLPPAGSRLWYRGYDTAVGFNENYVTRMYLEAGHEIRVTVVNSSGAAIRSSVLHVWSGSDVALDAWTILYVRTLNGDGSDRCAAVDLNRIVRPEQVIAGGGEPLEPARLHASELRTAGASPRVLHRFEFTTSEYVSFRHHVATFDGRCRRRNADAVSVIANLSPHALAGLYVALLDKLGAAITAAVSAKAIANSHAATTSELDAAASALAALKAARADVQEQGVAAFDQIWQSCFGSQPPAELPSALRLYVVEAKAQAGGVVEAKAQAEGPDVLLLESPEPIAWDRVSISAVMTSAIPMAKTSGAFGPDFGRPDQGFEVEYGGVRWLAGVELWVVDGALRARAEEPLSVMMYCDTARAIEVTLRVDAGGEATVWADPPLVDGPIVKEPSSMSQTVSLQTPPESGFTSVTIEGTGVGIESFSVTRPFVPRVPAASLRIIDARLPTASQPIDHEITLMALEGGSYEGYTVRWIDAVTPGASELYANISKIDLKPGQRLRVVPGRASAQAVDDALVQAGGSGATTPPRTGAVYQLVDPVGAVIHEHAVMPTTSIKPSALVALPNSDGARAFLVPRGNAQSIGRGYWDVQMKLTGDAGPDLDRWSIAGVPVAETAVLRFVIFAAAQPQQTITGKVVAIANGDTLTVLDASNKQHKIRLDGIDAPESWQDFRSRAKQSLSDLVFGKTVTVISSKKDRYGRTLGKIMLRGRNINLEQIQRGMAWFYLQYAEELSLEDWAAYWRAENAAQEELAGLWRGPSPTPPWLFRRGGRSAAPGPIIGNRASKIYHLPNCPDYSKVAERNRVPFKSEAEAQAAGYRRARNCSQ